MTVTATKIDSSNERGKNLITWAWSASTTIIYNNPVESDVCVTVYLKSFKNPKVRLPIALLLRY
jgi:hypothetical protein